MIIQQNVRTQFLAGKWIFMAAVLYTIIYDVSQLLSLCLLVNHFNIKIGWLLLHAPCILFSRLYFNSLFVTPWRDNFLVDIVCYFKKHCILYHGRSTLLLHTFTSSKLDKYSFVWFLGGKRSFLRLIDWVFWGITRWKLLWMETLH